MASAECGLTSTNREPKPINFGRSRREIDPTLAEFNCVWTELTQSGLESD